MGKILGSIVKLFLALLILAGLAGLSFWIVKVKGWPWWFAVAIASGLIGIWVSILFVRKYLVRSRERRFVQRVIDQDTAAIEKIPVSQRHELLELQDHWKESVKRLQESHLRKKGNPLYVLPWYLILGESRAGKTSAIRNARQSTPMSEISRSSGLSGTRNCDWWFFDQAILLDTAGRYTIPLDEGPDLEEWKQFLVLLSKYRKKEPLNGVIVAAAADKLLAAEESQLREEGQSIRQRIDQMMRTMGAKFPIYVLITKMDLVHGFTEFNRQLPPGSLAQAMGYTNTGFKIYWRDVFEETMGSISKRLKDLRFLLVHHTAHPDPGAILFPNEFERMAPGMALFLDAVFEENPYQETPLFRGLFFSSALRSGTPTSEFLSIAALQPASPPPQDAKEGFFLKDFFAGILPKDRDLFTPLREFVLWRRLTRSLGLLSWVLLCLSVCGLLGFSFYHNTVTISGFTEDFFNPPKLAMDRTADLLMLDKMRLEILEMERANRNWVLPRFGLNQSLQVMDRLKRDFVKLFREGYLRPLEDKVTRDIERVDQTIPEDEFVDYVGYVVAQIGILDAYLSGKRSPLENEFRVIASDLLLDQDRNLLPEVSRKFGSIYDAYLTWNRDVTDTKNRLNAFRVALIDLIDKRGRDLRWLVRKWIPDAPEIHLNDFWGTAAIGDIRHKIYIPGAYTERGRKHIESFISYVEAALRDSEKGTVKAEQIAGGKAHAGIPGILRHRKAIPEAEFAFERRTKEFWVWYHQEFYRVWRAFIENSRQGEKRIENDAAWHRTAMRMATDQNPYFQLLERAAGEIKALGAGGETPDWAQMIVRIDEIRRLAKTEKEKKDSVKAYLVDKSDQLKKSVAEKVDTGAARDLEEKVKQAGAWNDYIQALEKIQVGVSSQKQCWDTYAGAFSFTGQATQQPEQSPLTVAYGNYYKVKTMMSGRTELSVVWDLVFGPQDFLMTFAADQTACFLQAQWREQVLSYLQGSDPDKTPRLLFDKSEGLVWKFLDTTAKPFIGRSEAGFAARKDFRKNALPFSAEFIRFLNQGSMGVLEFMPEYTVSLETLPLDVNDDAKVEPYGCTLQVNCADKKLILENYNYPKSATFKWSPEKCGDASLVIAFPDISLQKDYRGNMGFADFLNAFRNGTCTFTPEDFPDKKDHLKKMGVSSITISYKIAGARPVVQLLNRTPTQVPQKILGNVQCPM